MGQLEAQNEELKREKEELAKAADVKENHTKNVDKLEEEGKS